MFCRSFRIVSLVPASLFSQRCGPSRDCAAANGTYTKTMCPRVESLDPDAINFRGAVDVTMTGDMFVDVGLVQCAFDGVPTNATTFVSEAEVICEAPAGEAGTQIDVSLWVNGREYTTTPGAPLQWWLVLSACDCGGCP